MIVLGIFTEIKARQQNTADAVTAKYGTFQRLRVENIEGAWPSSDIAQSVREERYKKDRPEATAESRIATIAIVGII